MMLITKEISRKLPKLYANENVNPEDIKVPLKLFNPTGIGTWYITEYDPDTEMAFGWCDLGFPELGYVSLEELRNFKGLFGLGIERDAWWDSNTTLDQVMNGERS
jgi:hypothetical protein